MKDLHYLLEVPFIKQATRLPLFLPERPNLQNRKVTIFVWRPLLREARKSQQEPSPPGENTLAQAGRGGRDAVGTSAGPFLSGRSRCMTLIGPDHCGAGPLGERDEGEGNSCC